MRWNSPVPPSVRRLIAWVWPRVNRALPCVRGMTPTSHVIWRISSVPRPSGRRFCTAMRSRTMSFSSFATARFTCTARSASASSPTSASMAAFFTSAVASWRAFLSSAWVAASRAAPNCVRTSSSTPSSTAYAAHRPLGLAGEALQLELHVDELPDLLVRHLSASTTTSSVTSLAPASTITMASAVPVTTRSRSDSFWVSSRVGLMTSSPSMRPTRTDPMGPSKGISLRVSAAEAPMLASDVVGVLEVDREHGRHDVDLVHEALGEQRPDRPVDLASGQDGLLAGP